VDVAKHLDGCTRCDQRRLCHEYYSSLHRKRPDEANERACIMKEGRRQESITRVTLVPTEVAASVAAAAVTTDTGTQRCFTWSHSCFTSSTVNGNREPGTGASQCRGCSSASRMRRARSVSGAAAEGGSMNRSELDDMMRSNSVADRVVESTSRPEG
jgi:hypothetical protein